MRIWVATLAILLSGCMSTRIGFKEHFVATDKPTYEDYVDYYVAGFVGDPELNLQKICMDQRPYEVQRLRSAADIFITFVTLSIYSPSTVRVWCGD